MVRPVSLCTSYSAVLRNDLNPLEMSAFDYPAVRQTREEYAIVCARLAETTSRRIGCGNQLCMPTGTHDGEETGILARTRRLLAGDSTAARSGAGTTTPEDAVIAHRQLQGEENLLKAAQSRLNSNIERAVQRATQHRLEQMDFAQAREALANAALNLLEIHRAGLELTERIARMGFDLSESTGAWSGAHLPNELVEQIEQVASGDRVLYPDLQKYTADILKLGRLVHKPPAPALR